MAHEHQGRARICLWRHHSAIQRLFLGRKPGGGGISFLFFISFCCSLLTIVCFARTLDRGFAPRANSNSALILGFGHRVSNIKAVGCVAIFYLCLSVFLLFSDLRFFGRTLDLVAHNLCRRHHPALRRPHLVHQRGGRAAIFDLIDIYYTGAVAIRFMCALDQVHEASENI